MAVQWTEEKAIEFITRFLSKDIDATDKKIVASHKQDLVTVVSNVRRAIKQGKLDRCSERLEGLLDECEATVLELKFGVGIGIEPAEGYCLTKEIDREVGALVAKACLLLDVDLPGTYTRRMFQRWGYMGGMVRQVDAVKKIGTRGFLALAEIDALQCSAEYIVYTKAQEYGEAISQRLRKGCLEKMQEILQEHRMI